MGLLDSLNNIAKKSEEIVNSGSEIGKSLSKIVQDGSTAVTTVLPKKEIKNVNVATTVNDNHSLTQASADEGPMSFKSIGCSDKTISIIQLSLSDGVIDDKEKAMLLRQVQEEGIDIQEFDFLLSKTLEKYQKKAKTCIKELSGAFAMADRIATKEEKANGNNLAAALPKVSGMVSNPEAMAAAAITDTVLQTVGAFIKAPSKLNTFKAEIIRMIDIPMFPEVLIDFFSYANSQINEEKQRNNGKGLFTEWGERLFGKDIDLVPIWTDKMTHVMGKAVMRFGNKPHVMEHLNKWRVTPLKRLKALTDPALIEEFPFPKNASDFIEVLKYSFRISQDPSKPLKAPFSKLYYRIYKEGQKKYSGIPAAAETMEECRVRPIMFLMANLGNPAALVLFETPDRLSDLLEVLAFLRSSKDLKKLHQRVYQEACDIFTDDLNAIDKINEFKPRNLFGF